MLTYSVLGPEKVPEAFEKVKEHLPDLLRNFDGFASLFLSKACTFFEVGLFGGVFWLSNIRIGHKATLHVVLWDVDVKKEVFGSKAFSDRAIRDLFRLFRLKRLEAFIPTKYTQTCQWAERCGFTLEGILRKFDVYNEQPIDIAVYSLLKEEQHG